MKENLKFQGALTCHQGYTDHNTNALLLLCYQYSNIEIGSNQPLMASSIRFTT